MLLTAPLTINWALTNQCNFNCRHCYSRTDPSEELAAPVIRKAMAAVGKAGVLSVNFGGGEPLLRKDLIEIAAFASGVGIQVSMNSNGFLIDEVMARKLREAGFSKVGISIDSHEPAVHDSFRGVSGSHARATNALRVLHDAGIKTSISTVICRINHRTVAQLVSFARKLKVQQLNFHNFKCSGLGYSNRDALDISPGEWKEFYQEAIKARETTTDLSISLDDPIVASLGVKTESGTLVKGSICGKLSLNIKSNGDITPCGFIPLVAGNIVKDDLLEVWRGSSLLEKMRNKQPSGKCKTCRSYANCLGGCTARALALTGDINNPDPHCWVS